MFKLILWSFLSYGFYHYMTIKGTIQKNDIQNKDIDVYMWFQRSNFVEHF